MTAFYPGLFRLGLASIEDAAAVAAPLARVASDDFEDLY